jgi:hypothetical protein
MLVPVPTGGPYAFTPGDGHPRSPSARPVTCEGPLRWRLGGRRRCFSVQDGKVTTRPTARAEDGSRGKRTNGIRPEGVAAHHGPAGSDRFRVGEIGKVPDAVEPRGEGSRPERDTRFRGGGGATETKAW